MHSPTWRLNMHVKPANPEVLAPVLAIAQKLASRAFPGSEIVLRRTAQERVYLAVQRTAAPAHAAGFAIHDGQRLDDALLASSVILKWPCIGVEAPPAASLVRVESVGYSGNLHLVRLLTHLCDELLTHLNPA